MDEKDGQQTSQEPPQRLARRSEIAPERVEYLKQDAEHGVYILALTVRGERAIGRLGQHRFSGTYLYVGSAQGPGGFKRLLRHRQVALGQRPGKRWHIDYLLPGATDLQALWLKTEAHLECSLAALLSQVVGNPPLPGFGSTDCHCPSHLFKLRGGLTRVIDALKAAGLEAEAISLNG